MNIEKLVYLIEVAKTGSFSIASQNLFVSQSAISQSIISIEKKFNIKLFERKRGNRAVLTSDGEEIITNVKEIFIKYQELIEKVQIINNNVNGKLKISTTPGFFAVLLNPISAIRDDYPKINIEIFQKPGQDIIEDILEERSDIGVLPFIKHLLKNNDRLVYHNLFEAKLKLMVNKNSPLAEKTFVTPQQIVNETLITYDGEFIHWFKKLFYREFGIMNELFTTTNTDTLKKAVEENLGVSFVPSFNGVNYNLSDDVILLDIVDYDAVNLQYVWIMSSKRHCSSMITDYILKLKEELNS
ncbi:LysR family transcriptional regulator [Gottfriedia sp. NPDC057948]|uniref:LysR family transcriptional regulator n=1 Tax=Gottfriedia sp. NPDC057948 TaxID=3346287 RepID=UPI0036DABEFA